MNALLEGLRPEHEFSETISPDFASFTNALSDLGLRTEIEASWDAEYIMSRFIERWENSQEESQLKQGGYPRETFDQVGIAIKMILAWDYVSTCLFSKSKVGHELILETADDLRCSAVLSSEWYAKQSLQTLRNFCESCVGILYFQKFKQEFDAWLNDSEYYHFPDYRVMVKNLNTNGVFSAEESRFLHTRYTELNNSVHNKRNRLNMNLARMKKQINSSGIQDIAEWSREVKKTVSFMLDLYIRLWQVNYWQLY